MHISKIMFAVAALAAGTAMAATAPAQIAISSGASASKNNLKLALANRCTAAGGANQLAEYASGSNVSTYVCGPAGSFANPNAPTAAEYAAVSSVNFAGTAIAEVRLNVGGGSFTAVCLLAGFPGGTACPSAADRYVNPGTGALENAPGGSVVVGGLLDAEPNAFLASVRAGIANPPSVVSAAFGQTFGVAVSNDLYTAMFNDQASRLGTGCAVTDTARAECVPVIGKPQMTAIMSSNSSNQAYSRGANFLASGIASGTNLSYLRRVDTSGTQAVAQNYFLESGCSPNAVAVVPQGAATGTVVNAITVFGLASTGDVRTQLNLGGFSIGVISGENNQTNQSWKWLRVGGIAIAESAQPAQGGVTFTNTVTAKNGTYDFWYLSRIAQPAATGTAASFWTAVRAGFAAVPQGTTPGLFATSETTFSRGTASSCSPVFSN